MFFAMNEFGPLPGGRRSLPPVSQSALRERLLQQDLFEEFCDEFTREMNRLRMERRASLSCEARD